MENKENLQPGGATTKPAAGAAAKPAARPAAAAAPTGPAENELTPKVLQPNEVYAFVREQYENGYLFLENLTGMDWGEEGLGVIYQIENPETGKKLCFQTATTDRQDPVLASLVDFYDIA
ncbi:MAG: NADH-quinone oxidoreductase subunit C, partial [Alloprevotella sp.]